MRAFTPGLLLAFASCASGSVGTIGDYEILSVPAGRNIYAVGRPWKQGLGPDGEVPANAADSTRGPASIVAIAKDKTNATLGAWIGGMLSLGAELSQSSVEFLRLDETVITVLRDTYRITDADTVIWSTLAASRMTMILAKELSTKANIDVLSRELTNATGASVAISASGDSEGAYIVTSERPLVVGIIVVRLETSVASHPTRFVDLTPPMRGAAQGIGLDYTLQVSDDVDPIKRTCQVYIKNRVFPRWTGVTHVFSGPEPWVQPRRQVIDSSGANRESLVPQSMVWDTIHFEWDTDLEKCRAHVERQTVKPHRISAEMSRPMAAQE